MAHGFPESDWKVFRELREVALDRFCKRVLDQVDRFRLDASRIYHERYLDVLQLLRKRNEELARAFDDPRRSRMIEQLTAIQAYGLLEADELARLTPRTRATIEALAEEFAR